MTNFNKNIAIISLFLSIRLLYLIIPGIDFSINVPDSVFFSEAVLQGVDVGKRVNMFYLFLLITSVFLFLIYIGLHYLFFFFRIKPSQSTALAIISISGFFGILSSVIGWEAEILVDFLLIILLLKTIIYALGNLQYQKFRHFQSEIFSNISLSAAFLFYFGFHFLFNSSDFVEDHFLVIYSIFFVFMIAALHMLYSIYGVPSRKLFLLMLPVAAIPIWVFLSGEVVIFMKIVFDTPFRFKYLFLALNGLGFMGMGLWVWLSKFRRTISARKIMEHYILPSILVSIILLVYYQPFQQQSTEIFELANPANSMLRFFAFHQIPFLDYFSSHMLSEQWFGIIYHLIFGFNTSLDFMTYEFLNRIILILVIYYFFNQLLYPKELSILFILSIPFLFSIFFTFIALSLIVFFTSIKVIKNQSTANYFWLFSSIIILIVWRIDTGSAALFSTIIFVPLLFIISHKSPQWRSLIKGLGLIALLILLFTGIALALRGTQQIEENFLAALHYLKANQAHGYSRISKVFPHQFYIYHFFFPLFSLIAIFFISISLRKKFCSWQDSILIPGLSSIFFFLLYIANSQRGLVRHSFLEGTEMFLASTFFLALSLFVVFLVEQYYKNINRYIILFSSVFVVFVALKYFPLGKTDILFEKAIKTSGYKNFDLNFTDEKITQRIQTNEEFADKSYRDFKIFLDENLNPDQTFLDFSNTPMLYYYCEREIPGYFNQNLQNTVDDYLQLHLLSYLNPKKVPVVAFSNFPPSWFDATDGVPNTMRYYLIAEYIFENYQPYGIINNRSIWIEKSLNPEWDIKEFDNSYNKVQQYRYQKAAYYTGQYYKYNKVSYLDTIFQYNFPEKYFIGQLEVDIPDSISHHKNLYIQMLIHSDSHEENIKVSLRKEDEAVGDFLFDVFRGGQRYYMFRPGNHYKWFTHGADKLVLQVKHGMYPKKIVILKDNRIENQNPNTY